MLSDNILQFSFQTDTLDSDKKTNNRKNPFLYDNDLSIRSVRRDVSPINSENNMLVCDHFDQPLGYCSKMSSINDLTMAVKECKLKILTLIDDPESKSRFIERLIELNETLHTAKEQIKHNIQSDSLPNVSLLSTDSEPLNIAGHTLIKYRFGLSQVRHCEVCHGVVRVARSVYHCTDCDVHVHMNTNCIQGMHRVCPASNCGHPSLFSSQIITRRRFSSADNGCLIDIDSYPLTGSLLSQKFLCAECSHPLMAISSTSTNLPHRSQTKFCHYYRKFYCSACHWDNKFIIPSVYFILNKWKKMSVCRSAFIKLKYIWNRALFRMPLFWQQNNHAVESVLLMRKKLFSLRSFIHKCATLKKLCESTPDWIVDQPYLVTMMFCEAICDGSALETVRVLHSTIVAHILQCELCHSVCNRCQICNDSEMLFVMSQSVWACNSCYQTCIHETCGLTRYKEASEFVCGDCVRE